MAFSTKWEDHGVLWTYWGSLKAKDLIASNNEIYGDPRFDDIDYQIVDFRQVNENCLTMSDMRRIAFLDRAPYPRSRGYGRGCGPLRNHNLHRKQRRVPLGSRTIFNHGGRARVVERLAVIPLPSHRCRNRSLH